MKKIIQIIFELFHIILKDIYKTIVNLTKIDLLDIIEIIGFGLVINSLYGLTSTFNINDIIVLSISLYSALKVKQTKRK